MADDTLGVAGEGLAGQFDAAPADVAALYDNWVVTRYEADLAAWGYRDLTSGALSAAASRVRQRHRNPLRDVDPTLKTVTRERPVRPVQLR